MKGRRKTYRLVLDGDAPKRELEFEARFQLRQSAAQRYHAMAILVKQGLKLIRKNGYSPTPRVITRS